ncbi:NADP-dependent oxidoreductase [Rhodococcus oryzae]|uniref:NADP-dependent oxidoreductase n=1 Tax=Rhodococcus oryzae TaxID=2571143 RepID=A0ABY2REP6_9NOCA|nr:NADP-dependent oxidoreductase [Rhodococcus oryzae]TJZ73263.1 NADP-dependent oxidoreductase [Rhodococcus oryzae]
MKAVRIQENRGADNPEALVLEEAPYPQAATGDVIVRVRSASFVPDELDWPGTWTDRAGRDRTPSIPAHEVAGVVSEIPHGTTGFEIGDRVFGLTDWHRDGAAAEFVAVEARNLATIPESIGFREAAALPLAGLTAWQGLFRHGGLTYGDASGRTVVVHGGAGGTGSLVVQLAHAAGARVIATGRAAGEEQARGHGADDYVTLDSGGLDETRFGPVDLVFDTIGGEVLARSAALVRPGGTLVSITAPPPVAPVDGRAVFFIVEPDRHELGELARLAEQGVLRPHVGAAYPLAEARTAFLAKRRGIPGKVVLDV